MFDTAEVRWILDGTLPDAVRDWFGAEGSPTIEERTDRYIVLPGCETVGIKLRGGGDQRTAQLDVKAMRGHEEIVAFAAGVSGRAAGWTKWTLDLPDLQAPHPGLVWPTGLTTHKRRRLRRFTSPDGPIVEVPISLHVPGGCDVELATIAIDELDGDWWTLAFEAFGPRASLWEGLRDVGGAWFERRGSPPPSRSGQRLAPDASLPYPAWLSRLLEPQ